MLCRCNYVGVPVESVEHNGKGCACCDLLKCTERNGFMNYITVSEAAQKWGVSKSLVWRHLAHNRIPRAKCNDGIWSIPENAMKAQKLPNTPVETEELCALAPKLANQKKKRNYHGLYE